MDTQAVTELWMFSVIGIMLLSGIFAWIGHQLSLRAGESDPPSPDKA